MAFTIADRVFEKTIFVGGTGAVTLIVTPVAGYQTFLSGWGASGTGWYCLIVGAQWETGLGTLNPGGTTLTRTTVYNGSSGVGVTVNFSAGTMDCFGDFPAAQYGIFRSSGVNVSLTGNTQPSINFIPSSGATKTGQVYQIGDQISFAAANVADYLLLNLNDGHVTLNGSLAVSLPGTAVTKAIDVTNSSPNTNIGNADFSYNRIYIPNDRLGGVLNQNVISGLEVIMTSGGGADASSKYGLSVILNHTSASTPSVAGDYVAGNFRVDCSADYGGTVGTPKGTAFAAGFGAILEGNATNYAGLVGSEVDIGIHDSATANDRIGWNIVSVGEKHGTVNDAAYCIGASNSSNISWNTGFLIGSLNGLPAIQSTGTVMKFSAAATVDTVFDFSNVTATSYLIRGLNNKFTVDGGGHVTIAPSSAVNLTLSGHVQPQIRFSPSSGGTKVAQLYQNGDTFLWADANVADRMTLNLATGNLSLLTGRLEIAGATTATSQIRLAVGGPPTTPVDGDIWFESNTNTGLKIRVNGVTKTVTLT